MKKLPKVTLNKSVTLPQNFVPQRLDRGSLKSFNQNTKYKFRQINFNNTKEDYIVQDGPAYANGELHVGHLLNQVLKDVIVKSKIIQGHKVKFNRGHDCHGLPIELKASMTGTTCEDIANIYIEKQTATTEKFGIFSMGKPYKTLDISFKRKELGVYKFLLEKGYIYEDSKVVWYSPYLNTVLANSQLIYKDLEEEALYVVMGNFIVYTTAEWTLKANQAICINSNIQYVSINNNGLILSESLAKKWSLTKNEYKKIDFQNIPKTYKMLDGIEKPVLNHSFVQDDVGSGIVHLCGGHGEIDNQVLQENNINSKIVCESDKLLEHIDNYKADYDLYQVYHREKIIHSYPVDDRMKLKVYPILTKQFFVKIHKDKCLRAIKKIKMSSKNRNKLINTLLIRPDWCISRQRTWGVKIPKTNHILDVWFDSGCVFTLNKGPADLYIEGEDQYRGWFQSSVILAALLNRIPAKHIVSHGFILDQHKEKLSKSSNNFSALDELYDKYNPDVLRLWVTLSDWKNDIIFSESSLKNAADYYFKIRNWLRYLRNNITENRVIDTNIKELITLKDKINELYNSLDFRGVNNEIFKFLQKYSASLTEDYKNYFYELPLKSKERIEIEIEFNSVLKTLVELLYPITPFLCSELEMSYEIFKNGDKN